MYCGQNTLVNRRPGGADAKVLRCKSWRCPDCKDGRRRRLVAEAIGGDPTTFITLTLRAADNRDSAEQVKALSRGWRIIRARICRRWKIKSIPFLAVVERTKKGTPHLHILTRVRYIDQRWLSVAAAEILDAPIVWIERIDQHRGIARYVSKYVGKDPEQFGTCKRYWQSPNYDRRPERQAKPHRAPGSFTDLWLKPMAKVIACYQAWGYTAQQLSPDRWRFSEPEDGLWRT